MEDSFHYLLMANLSIVQKKLFKRLNNDDLTLGQPKVLDYLRYNDGASQKDIAKACCIEAGSLTSVLRRMEDKNIIERRMLNGNRRSNYVFLTDYGKELMADVEKGFYEIESEIFQNISHEEYESFMRTFKKIYNNLKGPEY